MPTTDLFQDIVSPGKTGPVMVGGAQGSATEAAEFYTDPLVLKINSWIKREESRVYAWREKARQAYRFYAGKQLSEEDERVLKSERRPTNAFNAAQKYIRYVSGVERESYVALIFNAINQDNTQAQLWGERIAKYYDWAVRHANGNDSRSRAFEDMLVCGMGWCEAFLDRSKDPRGLVGYKRKSPLTMLWPETDEVNLDNARWLACEEYVEKDEARILFPDSQSRFLIDQADSHPADPRSSWPQIDKIEYIIPYVHTYPLSSAGQTTKKKGKLRILHFQWWDIEGGYVFEDPLDGTQQWLDEKTFQFYAKNCENEGAPIEHKDFQAGRKYKRIHILNRRHILHYDPDEKLPGNVFTFNPMACHWDEEEREFYGFMRVLIDPQKYTNKFFNQIIEIMGKQAKGGAIVEDGGMGAGGGAFVDKAQMDEFLDTYSMPGSVNRIAPNALKEGRFKEKTIPQIPQGSINVLEVVVKSMETVTGLSDNALGLGAGTQPGTAMQKRQRAGFVLLAPEFDCEAQFRRREGKIFMGHLELIADDRLIRVGGMYQNEVFPLEEAPFSIEYELELDEVEHDPNIKQDYVQWIIALLPYLQKGGLVVPAMLDFLPLPRRFLETIKQQMAQKQQMEQQMRQQGLPIPGQRGPVKTKPQIDAEIFDKKMGGIQKLAKGLALIKKGGQDDIRQFLEALIKGQEQGRENQQQQIDLMQGASQAPNPGQGIGG